MRGRWLFGSRTARLIWLVLVTAASVVVALFLLLPLAVRGFVLVIVLASRACVWVAGSIGAGVDTWTLLAAIGRSTGAFLVSPQVLAVGGGLVLVGAIALYGLQRLLDSEEESPR